MNEPIQTERPRRRVLLAVVLSSLAAAVALPVSAALAGGGEAPAAGGGGTGSGATFEQVQQDRAPDQPRGHDCPEEEGQSGGGNSDSASPEV